MSTNLVSKVVLKDKHPLGSAERDERVYAAKTKLFAKRLRQIAANVPVGTSSPAASSTNLHILRVSLVRNTTFSCSNTLRFIWTGGFFRISKEFSVRYPT